MKKCPGKTSKWHKRQKEMSEHELSVQASSQSLAIITVRRSLRMLFPQNCFLLLAGSPLNLQSDLKEEYSLRFLFFP